MAFDFPANPTEGQQFTPPGGPTYTWQNPRWIATGFSAGGGFPEAPNDGKTYGRQSLSWNDLTDEFAAKAALSHTHSIQQIVGLETTLTGKEPYIAPGTTAHYWRGDKTWQPMPAVGGGGEPPIAAGTTSQWWRGDKTWQTLPVQDWATIVGKPTSFPPSTHNHPQSEVTNLTTDLALKAPLASPVFTGNPTAPTPTAGDNDTSIATTQFVNAAISAVSGLGTAMSGNRIINPSMRISQEYGETQTTPVAGGSAYIADQWLVSWVLTGGTASTKKTSPAGSGSPYGSGTGSDYIGVFVNGPLATLAAGDYMQILQMIEGINMADFEWGSSDAHPVILRFAAKSNVSGTFTVFVKNGAANRTFLAPFTVVAAPDVYQQFVIPIPGDTVGTVTNWPSNNNNNTGVMVGIGLASGSSFGGGVAGWQAGNKIAIAGSTNFAAASNQFYLTDVGLYNDPAGTGLAPKWEYPNNIIELQKCTRYYTRAMAFFSGSVTMSHVYHTAVTLPAMRAIPTLTAQPEDANGFADVVGTLYARTNPQIVQTTTIGEYRTCSVASYSGVYSSTIIANARMTSGTPGRAATPYVSCMVAPPDQFRAETKEVGYRNITCIDDQDRKWWLTEDSTVDDWVDYVRAGGTVDPYVADPNVATPQVEQASPPVVYDAPDVNAVIADLKARLAALEAKE